MNGKSSSGPQKASRNSKNLSTDIESRLLKIFSSVLHLNQLTGYFPLRVDSKKGLSPQNCSFPFIWSIFLILTGIVGGVLTVIWIVVSVETFQYVFAKHSLTGNESDVPQRPGPTEEFVYHILFTSGIFMSVWFKINGLRKRDATVSFWKANITKLEKFAKILHKIRPNTATASECENVPQKKCLEPVDFEFAGENGSGNSNCDRMLDDLMNHVGRSLRKYVWVASGCATIGFLVIFGIYVYHFIIFTVTFLNDPDIAGQTNIEVTYFFLAVATFCLACLYFFVFFLHFSHSLYLSAFLKVYQSCLKYVGRKIKALVDDQEEKEKDEEGYYSHSKDVDPSHRQEVTVSGNSVENIVITFRGSQKKKTDNEGQQNLSEGDVNSVNEMEIPDGCKIEKEIESYWKAYNTIEDLIEDFNNNFKWEILAELLFSILVVLMFGFFVTFWMKQAQYTSVFIAFIPVCIFSLQIFLLGSQGSLVVRNAEDIGKYFHLLNLDNFSLYFQVKILLISNKILTGPPNILPGAFLKLDRYLIISILSALSMYLIVLAQFRVADQGGEPMITCNSTGT